MRETTRTNKRLFIRVVSFLKGIFMSDYDYDDNDLEIDDDTDEETQYTEKIFIFNCYLRVPCTLVIKHEVLKCDPDYVTDKHMLRDLNEMLENKTIGQLIENNNLKLSSIVLNDLDRNDDYEYQRIETLDFDKIDMEEYPKDVQSILLDIKLTKK